MIILGSWAGKMDGGGFLGVGFDFGGDLGIYGNLGYCLIPRIMAFRKLGGGVVGFLACLTTFDVPNDFFSYGNLLSDLCLGRRSGIFIGKESMEAGCERV